MKNKLYKIGGLLIMISFLLSACVVKVENVENNQDKYGRETTKAISSNYNFGSGKTDDIYVVLDYIYESKEFEEKYGDCFEVKKISGSADNQTFLWLYKGSANYIVNINGDDWLISLSKS